MQKILWLLLVLFLFSCENNLERKNQSISVKDRISLEKSSDQEIESKISDLLGQMTLEEKIGQMMQINNSQYAQSESLEAYYGAPPDVLVSIDTTKLVALLDQYHIGSFLNGIAVSAQAWHDYSKQLQEINMQHSRLKIPLIYGIDHMHGANYLENSTIFPHSINIAATFDTDFSESEGKIVGLETADLGHHWIFCPVVDLGKNPLWPRFYETYGEDPYLSAAMGSVYVEALQNNPGTSPYKQAATAKHFIGYSDPKNGWDRTPAEISDQSLHEFFVPPFQALVDAGIKTFMINGGEVNGVPVHASYELLTKLLRDQMGFKGVVVTDWEDVIRLHSTHKVARDMKEATYKAIMAGIDMSMTPYETDFFGALKKLVEEGSISMERIDLSVSRILRLKFDLGLFENPYPRDDRFDVIRKDEHVQEALNTARESIVLVKNDDVLPLSDETRIVVAGLNADSKKGLCGGWTLRWIPTEEDIFPEYMPTFFEALQQEFGQNNVTLATAENLIQRSRNAGAIVLAVGEEPYSETPGNITDLSLAPEQMALVNLAISTGKPVILVMIAGRPRMITPALPSAKAFIWAGLPGFEGGTALAEIISGKVNPSGKMPFSYPAQPNHWYPYNHKNMEQFFDHPDTVNTIAGFGHGLSYTTFTYSNLNIDKNEISGTETITARVTVTNTGSEAGKESVLWFIRDEVGNITRPVKALKHFEKRLIQPNESLEFTFEINPEKDLSYPDKHGEKRLEAGSFQVIVDTLSHSFNYK